MSIRATPRKPTKLGDFSRFAPEVRHRIWDYCLYESNTIVISRPFIQETGKSPSETKGLNKSNLKAYAHLDLPTPLFHVCQETRKQAQSRYPKTFTHQLYSPIPFNYETGLLYLLDTEAMEFFWGLSSEQKAADADLGLDEPDMSETYKNLRYLCLGADEHSSDIFDMLADMRALEIVYVLDEGDVEPWDSYIRNRCEKLWDDALESGEMDMPRFVSLSQEEMDDLLPDSFFEEVEDDGGARDEKSEESDQDDPDA